MLKTMVRTYGGNLSLEAYSIFALGSSTKIWSGYLAGGGVLLSCDLRLWKMNGRKADHRPQSSFPVVMSPSKASLSSPSDVSLVPPPGSELRCPDAGRYCWTFEAHLDQVDMPMVPMRRTQQVKKTFRIAPCGPTKIPAIILGDMKDILAAALLLRLTAANYCRLSESYRWQSAWFGARFRYSNCLLLRRHLR